MADAVSASSGPATKSAGYLAIIAPCRSNRNNAKS